MKLMVLIALIGLLLTAIPACAQGSALSMLRAQGTNIVNEQGTPVLLRGVNVGGWLVQEGWMCLTNAPSQTEAFAVLDERFGRETRDKLFAAYEDHFLTEEDFDNIRALGMNVVRLPFAWWTVLDDGGALREDAFARMDWLVECCAARGMYAVLDLHAAPGSQNGKDHSGDITGANLWKNAAHQDLTVYLWEQVAAHYRGNPAVAAYDLLNEPGGDLNRTSLMQWEFYNRMYKAVRAVDPDHIIMMESCWAPEDLPSPERYGWENVVYQYHYYKWDADNDYNAQKLSTDVNLFKLKQAAYPVPSFVGEFTLFQSMDAWRYALQQYSQAGIHFTIWTYKVTGRSTWGLYNTFGDKADIYNDSAEQILRKWTNQGMTTRNETLCAVVAEVLSGKDVQLPEQEAALSGQPVMEIDVSSAAAVRGARIAFEDEGLRLTVLRSGDPGESANAFFIPLEGNTDFSSYTYLTFYIMDLQGSNTHRVTLRDGSGKTLSLWVDVLSERGAWKRINAPLSMFSGIDLSDIRELGIGEWNSGDYLFGRIYLCSGTMDE